MADYVFEDWQTMLSKFQDCVKKDLAEIHQQKVEIQQMKSDLFKAMEGFKIYRDENRLILSAPEVVIGNVDESGDLIGGTGKVIIKGDEVALDGVGDTGHIVSRAPSIRQIAVNPGSDGIENVVCDTSEIVTQACSIVMEGSNATDAFTLGASSSGKGVISIHADNQLQIGASVSSKLRKELIESSVGVLTSHISALEKAMATKKEEVDGMFESIKSMLEQNEEFNTDDSMLKSANTIDMIDLQEQMEETLPLLCHSTMTYVKMISELAEANRMKTALEAEKKTIVEGDDFKNNTTGASMQITAESISVDTADADGNLHTNTEAGLRIRAPRVSVSMTDDKGGLIENSEFMVRAENIDLLAMCSEKKGNSMKATGSVNIASKNVTIEAIDYEKKDEKFTEKALSADGKVSITAKSVEVSTAGPANIEYDDGKITKGEYKAEGDVLIKSKNVTVESLDYEVADGALKTKALTKDGTVSIRAEKTNVLAADAEGKATGSISLNAKAISLKSMDVDKESLADSALAAGSSMVLVSEKVFAGAKSKDVKSKKVQVLSEEIAAIADKTFEAQQGDGKAVVQLTGGNASVGGSKTTVYGTTEVKSELKAPKATINDVQAKSHFKSQNIEDGMAVGAGGGGSLSAKLKAEDAPSK